ncbi:hypothetical protein BDA99DRAFT_542456 [Phascolomyces articulosus]|uniref:Uncharacterized protein n=1 Tax=Phascolomyces articulosus TaxID=60185 RepID=A0AAD5JQK3_9FUNG|nr:hypothetical protein BDA99DRAFT_542456 [Phascolomyces articulosus]
MPPPIMVGMTATTVSYYHGFLTQLFQRYAQIYITSQELLDIVGNIKTLTDICLKALDNVSTSGIKHFLNKLKDQLKVANLAYMLWLQYMTMELIFKSYNQ